MQHQLRPAPLFLVCLTSSSLPKSWKGDTADPGLKGRNAQSFYMIIYMFRDCLLFRGLVSIHCPCDFWIDLGVRGIHSGQEPPAFSCLFWNRPRDYRKCKRIKPTQNLFFPKVAMTDRHTASFFSPFGSLDKHGAKLAILHWCPHDVWPEVNAWSDNVFVFCFWWLGGRPQRPWVTKTVDLRLWVL